MRITFLAVLLLASGCGGGAGDVASRNRPPIELGNPSGGEPTPTPVPAPPSTPLNAAGMVASDWKFGPIIGGVNTSVGVPKHPQDSEEGLQFEIPIGPTGHVHYVTRAVAGGLGGKTRIRMRYRLDIDPGVEIVPRQSPGSPAIITLYFQRGGDDWSGLGAMEAYRWWATFTSHIGLVSGTYEMIAPLDGKWTAVQTSDAFSNASGFRAAKDGAAQVGFTFGGGTGYGHGVASTGRARFILQEFAVE